MSMQENRPMGPQEKEQKYNEEINILRNKTDVEIGKIRDRQNRGVISQVEADRAINGERNNLRTAISTVTKKYYPSSKLADISPKKTIKTEQISKTPTPMNAKMSAAFTDENPEANEKIKDAYIKLLKKQLGDSK